MNQLKTQIFRSFYRYLLKPILFLTEPEITHNTFTKIGQFLGRFQITNTATRQLFSYQHPALCQTIKGIVFPNPVGLAAGFDKDANLTKIMDSVGFGFMQAGTVTDQSYKGNPKPRLYRLPRSKGAVVYFGLKNIGVTKIIAKLKNRNPNNFPLGISLGKTNSPKTATAKTGIDDYCRCLKKLLENKIGDFYTINISCPNTFGGEPFTTPEKLNQLLKKLTSLKIGKPVFLKMPINTPWQDFKKLLDVAIRQKIDGVIIGNLNKNRQDPSIKDQIPSHVKGGISGKPCWHLSNQLIAKTHQDYGKKLVIIGVGGIFSAKDAYEKIKRGASLVSLITGMIYEGPQLIGEINRGLVELLKKDGYNNIQEAIGKK
jgi:dihydroorotate dehydrogenase subfamily 2